RVIDAALSLPAALRPLAPRAPPAPPPSPPPPSPPPPIPFLSASRRHPLPPSVASSTLFAAPFGLVPTAGGRRKRTSHGSGASSSSTASAIRQRCRRPRSLASSTG